MKMEGYVPDTENRNPATMGIDEGGILDMLRIINEQDMEVPRAVGRALGEIALVVERAEKVIRGGGRVVYIGAGTSGRLGVLDASECPPTYGVSADLFVGVIAGGEDALVRSSEGKEDRGELGVRDLEGIGFSARDMLIGLAASGRTPYVIGALEYARALGAATACVVCSKASPMEAVSSIAVVVDVGPEVVTGSTRMKSGTAQKLVLNMISTGTMIRFGKVYGNLMVDVRPTNSKLVARAKRIIMEVTGCTQDEAGQTLQASGDSVKTAIVMLKKHLPPEEAAKLLAQSEGRLKQALGEA